MEVKGLLARRLVQQERAFLQSSRNLNGVDSRDKLDLKEAQIENLTKSSSFYLPDNIFLGETLCSRSLLIGEVMFIKRAGLESFIGFKSMRRSHLWKSVYQ